MPNWKPGEQAGKKVNVRYTIPIKARLRLEITTIKSLYLSSLHLCREDFFVYMESLERHFKSKL